MNIISIDYEKGTVQSDFFHWKIVSNNDNKFLLLQREESGRFHAAEADVKMKQIWEVKEISKNKLELRRLISSKALAEHLKKKYLRLPLSLELQGSRTKKTTTL